MMKVTFLLVACLLVAAAQHSENLRKKYGPPVAETYIVRPGIAATVTLSKSGDVCQMLVEPERRLTNKSQTPKLKREVLDGVLDELVPQKERGKPLMAGFVNARCLPDDDCWGSSAAYERLSIYYNNGGSGSDEYRFATISWKREGCAQ